MRVLAVLHRRQPTMDSFANQVDGDVSQRDGDNLVERIWIATAEVIREIADHGFLASALSDLLAQRVANVHFFLVPISIGLAIFLNGAALPDGALGGDDESIT